MYGNETYHSYSTVGRAVLQETTVVITVATVMAGLVQGMMDRGVGDTTGSDRCCMMDRQPVVSRAMDEASGDEGLLEW